MATKNHDPILLARVKQLRDGLGPQPLATLWAVEPSLRVGVSRYRRILCGKVYWGDLGHIERMEKAKEKLTRARQ